MPVYFDAHAHLQNMVDLKKALLKAETAQIQGIICNATHEDDWGKVIELSKTYSNIHVCLGVHPWFLGSLKKGWEARLERLLKENPSYMVGEIGLDKVRADQDPVISSLDNQERVMRIQMDLAAQYNRPFHMHCVHAWDRIMHVLKRNKRPDFFVSHAHHGNIHLIPVLAEMGAFFSYASTFVSPERKKVRACLAATPLDRLLVESDCPDLSSEPAEVPKLVKHMAVVRQQDETVLIKALYQNAERICYGR